MTRSARDLSPDQKRVVESLLGRPIHENEEISVVASAQRSPGTRPHRHISDVIAENMRDVPPEILETLPSDGAGEHDHYIYGLPKRQR